MIFQEATELCFRGGDRKGGQSIGSGFQGRRIRVVRACVFSPAVSIRWVDKIAYPGPNEGEPNQKIAYIPAGSVKDSQAK